MIAGAVKLWSAIIIAFLFIIGLISITVFHVIITDIEDVLDHQHAVCKIQFGEENANKME